MESSTGKIKKSLVPHGNKVGCCKLVSIRANRSGEHFKFFSCTSECYMVYNSPASGVIRKDSATEQETLRCLEWFKPLDVQNVCFENQSPELPSKTPIAPDAGDFFLPPGAQPSQRKEVSAPITVQRPHLICLIYAKYH